jgi:hypothetical protein
MNLINLINEYCDKKGIKLKDLPSLCGVSIYDIRCLEASDRDIVREKLFIITNYLEIPYKDVLKAINCYDYISYVKDSIKEAVFHKIPKETVRTAIEETFKEIDVIQSRYKKKNDRRKNDTLC